jgi:hypothetical protein
LRGGAGDAGRSAAYSVTDILKALRARLSRKKTVAGNEQGVIKFPVLRHWLRIVGVARSAF